MLTNNDRERLRVHYLNRFRNQSFDGHLPVDQTETNEYKIVDRRIKNLEAELTDARRELYELNQAFDTISREERVRVAKIQLGVRSDIDALLQEVYGRAQQCTKLQGDQFSARHELPNAYYKLSAFVTRGAFGGAQSFKYPHRRYNPLFVEHELMSAAARVMYYDNTKKGRDLSNRTWLRRNDIWKQWSDADQPTIESYHCVKCNAEGEKFDWRGVCPTCQEKEDE